MKPSREFITPNNNWKKNLDLFYLLYLLKVILVLDLFAEIRKSCIKFVLPSSLYTFRFQLERGCLNHIEFNSGTENESIFVIFVYNCGIKYGKETCGVARKHNQAITSCSIKLLG